MHRGKSVWFGLLVVSASLVTASTSGHPVEAYVPERALGFLVIHDLQRSSDRIGSMIDLWEVSVPAPLTFFKLATGFNAGFDPGGDVVIGLYPGQSPEANPGPFVLVPVDDYAAFAAPLGADPEGGISAVRVAGQWVLVARRGPFALLMNTDFRPAMERVVASKPAIPAALQAYQPWCADQDLALVVLSEGRSLASRLMRRQLTSLARQRPQSDRQSPAGRTAAAVEKCGRCGPSVCGPR